MPDEQGPVRGLARLLRRNTSDAERMLWKALTKDRRFAGQFKRQTPVGRQIPDFVSFVHRLAIELIAANETRGRGEGSQRAAGVAGGSATIASWTCAKRMSSSDLDGVLSALEKSLRSGRLVDSRHALASIFSALMREASVVGFMSISSAAPPRPNTLPPEASSAATMLARS